MLKVLLKLAEIKFKPVSNQMLHEICENAKITRAKYLNCFIGGDFHVISNVMFSSV